MDPRLKTIAMAALLAASAGAMVSVVAENPAPIELSGYPKMYERWFEEAAAEFDVPVELLQSISYAETRWKQIVPRGQAKNAHEPVQEMEWHEGDMPPAYGIMGLRNDTYFGTSLVQAATMIGQAPAALINDTRSNIRGAAALLAKFGAGKNRFTPLEQWEDAIAQFSGIPQREIAEVQSYEVLNAIHEGRGSGDYKIKQRKVDLEKVYGNEKLKKLSAPRIAVQFTNDGATISVPQSNQ